MHIGQMEFLGWGLEKVLLQFAVLGATGPSHVGWGGAERDVYIPSSSTFIIHTQQTPQMTCVPLHSKSPSPKMTFINSIYWPKHKRLGFNGALSQIQ